MESPRFAFPLFFSDPTYPSVLSLGDLIQSQHFKYHLHFDDSQKYHF